VIPVSVQVLLLTPFAAMLELEALLAKMRSVARVMVPPTP
jgi:hypothetical protein